MRYETGGVISKNNFYPKEITKKSANPAAVLVLVNYLRISREVVDEGLHKRDLRIDIIPL